MTEKILRGVILILVFFSGFGSLVYQICWQRVLTQVIGLDTYSVNMIVSIFMLGLGIGGYCGFRLVQRFSRTKDIALLLCGAISLISVFGFFGISVIRSVNHVLNYVTDDINVALLVNFFLLLLPTILMGITTPLMVELFRQQTGQSSTSNIYSINIFGASVGIIVSGFFLLGTLGLSFTCNVIALVDLIVAFGFWYISKNLLKEVSPSQSVVKENQTYNFKVNWLVCSSFLIGFAALGYEIVYFRLFTSFFGVTPYVFPILLFSYLINMSIGTRIIKTLLTKYREDQIFFGGILLSIVGVCLVLSFPSLCLQLGLNQQDFVYSPYATSFDENFHVILISLVISFITMIPIASISAIFPLFVRKVNSLTSTQNEGAAFGKVYFCQTMGNFLGSLMTGFLLYRFFNTLQILTILSFILIISNIFWNYAFSESKENLLKKHLYPIFALIPLLFYNYDYYNSIVYNTGFNEYIRPNSVKDFQYGMNLLYSPVKEAYHILAGGRFYVTGFPSKYYDGKNMETATTIGNPALVYSINKDVKRILFIGLGNAVEIYEFSKLFPQAEVEVVEINKDVTDFVRTFGAQVLVDKLKEAKVYHMDGRRFLTFNKDKKYDYIHIGVARASTSGAGNLFSREFLKVVHEHLTANGMVSFYAYPPVLKAAVNIFDDIAIFKQSNGTCQAICLKNGSIFKKIWPQQFVDNFNHVINNVYHGNSNNLYTGNDIFYISKDSIKEHLVNIPESTDDFLATEYYLNQRTELLPGVSTDGRPLDMRMLPVLSGVQYFPWPDVNRTVAKEHEMIFQWDLEKSEKPLELTDMIFVPGKGMHFATVRIPFYSNRSSKVQNHYNWTLPLADELNKIRGKYITMKIKASKSGFGWWGCRLLCERENGQSTEKYVNTYVRGTTDLVATIHVPNDVKSIKANVTYNHYSVLGMFPSFDLKSVRLYVHNDILWAPAIVAEK